MKKKDFRYSSVFKLKNEDADWVEKQLSKMTLKEKVAQMVMPYAMAIDTADDPENFARLVDLVKNEKVGGVLFLTGDIKNQLFITNELRSISKLPLLIAADYERGVGTRLEDGVEFPTNMAIGAVNKPTLTYLVGKVTALEGRTLGVEQDFAPIVDINDNPDNPIINIRAYSSDSKIVSANGTAFIRGLQAGKMLSTAKHFPGHGATDIDSHSEIPIISLSKSQLFKNDLIPFENAIKAGVTSVMVGHLDVPALEKKKGLPATFSKSIVTDLLQNKFGFDGLVVTDALNMNAIQNHYTQEEAGVLSVEAGNDVLLFPADEKAVINGVVNAVKKGQIPEERIDKSVRKILAAKRWLQLKNKAKIDSNIVKRVLNQPSHWRLANEIAEKSITLVKNKQKLIPVNPAWYRTTSCILLTDADDKKDYPLERYFKENFKHSKFYELYANSSKRDYRKALRIAKSANLVLLPALINVREKSGTVGINEKHRNFIKEILKLKKRVVLMSLGNPYILRDFPKAKTYICSYGSPAVSQKAMMDAILGRNKIEGKLPVSIPDTKYKIGWGIDLHSNGLYFQNGNEDTNYVFTKVDSLMNKAVADSVFPGAVLLIGQRGKVIYERPFGHFTYRKNSKKMTLDAIFDLASVSKVVGTTTAAMMLVDKGKLNLDDKVIKYLPKFDNHGKGIITIRNLLMHDAGFVPWKPFYKKYKTERQIINDIMNTNLEYKPGTETKYSDLSMITLQLVIQKITGMRLDKFLRQKLFKRLAMKRTMYNPPAKYRRDCVPTEKDNYWRMMTMKGKVHDETAYLMNGVAGHAGLFSTARDLAKFMYMMLNNGMYGNKKILNPATVNEWTRRQTESSSRGLGWDTKSEGYASCGELFSKHSFGHTGFTGTSVWADKDRELFVILLTNRVYPTRKNRKIIKFRPLLHNAVIKAVDYDF